MWRIWGVGLSLLLGLNLSCSKGNSGGTTEPAKLTWTNCQPRFVTALGHSKLSTPPTEDETKAALKIWNSLNRFRNALSDSTDNSFKVSSLVNGPRKAAISELQQQCQIKSEPVQKRLSNTFGGIAYVTNKSSECPLASADNIQLVTHTEDHTDALLKFTLDSHQNITKADSALAVHSELTSLSLKGDGSKQIRWSPEDITAVQVQESYEGVAVLKAGTIPIKRIISRQYCVSQDDQETEHQFRTWQLELAGKQISIESEFLTESGKETETVRVNGLEVDEAKLRND